MSIPQALIDHGRVPEVWGKVPQRNKNFTGREGLLDKLYAGILGEVTAVVPHALHGLGGVGKTQVAIEYAYRYRSQYDLVWWIPADQPVLVRASLAALTTHLGLPPASVTGIEDATAAVLDALRRGEPYGRWLLIFDNADQPEDINDIIPRGPGHVLITSRNHRWEGVVDTLPVDVFSREESVAFLSRRVRAMAPEDADELSEELGDLPLALEQAGALQAETGMSVREYLRLLHEHTARLLNEGKPTEYPQSMTAVWALSVSQLQEKLPEAVEVLRCCAFFGPEPIPRDLFGLPAEESERSGLGRLLNDPILLSRAIRELGRFALAKVDSRNRTIQVHRLIQALIRDELSDELQERFRHEVHLLLAAATAPGDPDDVTYWPRYSELVAHVRPAFVATCQVDHVRQFALNVVRFLYSSGDFEIARSFVEEMMREWEQDSGPEHRDVLVARRLLGDVLRELGQYPIAYKLNRNTLEAMRRTLGPEDHETLRVTNSHGGDLRARGEFPAALEHDKESRLRHERVFGPGHRWTLRTVNNLALDYGLISDYSTCRNMHESAYVQSGPGSGVSRQDAVAFLTGLARAVRLLGDYGEACDLGEDAYGMGVQELGAEHHLTLRATKDLSIAQRRAGLIDDGFELAQETYERDRRLFGLDHPDSLAAAMGLANALRAVGRTDEALDLARDTAAIYPQIYGDTHPYNFGIILNLALLQRVHGDVAEARASDMTALEGLDRTVGRDHHYSLTCAMNLASDLADLGEVEAALALSEDTYRRLVNLLGQHHPMTVACAANLSIDLATNDAEEEAARMRAEALDSYGMILSPDHPDVVVAKAGHRLDFDFDPPPI